MKGLKAIADRSHCGRPRLLLGFSLLEEANLELMDFIDRIALSPHVAEEFIVDKGDVPWWD